MAADKATAVGVEEDKEARGISKGDQLCFLGIEVYAQGLEICDLALRGL
jgi:hypothetical protein